jgi:hypothetical protein
MNSKQRTAALGLVAAATTALVSFGVLGGDQATAVQGVLVAGITLAAAILIQDKAE